jgi:hypothetical protein
VIKLRKETQNKIPIARCANLDCRCAILYSDNPKDKKNVTVRIAEPNYSGFTYLCPRCKTMRAIIEKPKVAIGYIAIPIVASL